MTEIATPLMSKIRNSEILDAETEFALAKAWISNGDTKARQKLIESYLKLAHKEARKVAKYRLPINDLMQEATIGLIKAVDKFDPEKGFRLSTYALHWIRAMLNEYRLRNQGMVRVGTTSDKKALFFNLPRVRNLVEQEASRRGETLGVFEVHMEIAKRLNTSIEDVQLVEACLRRDTSLNAPLPTESEDPGATFQDFLVDEGKQAEDLVEEKNTRAYTQKILLQAMEKLTPRERHIVVARKMSDKPATLEELGVEYNISRERIRQIEVIGLKKIKSSLPANCNVNQMVAA